MVSEPNTSRRAKIAGKAMLIHEADSARERMGAALMEVGIEALLRHTTIGAQAQILRERPDVVVIDAAMPLMSGPEFTRAIRQHPALRHTVVLLSGPSATGLAAIARECGADGTLVHSDMEDLVRTVQGWIARGTRKPEGTPHGYLLVACGNLPGRELGRALQSHTAARVTDSGTEALRLLFSREAPVLLMLGTALSDIPPKKLLDSALEIDRKWARRVIVVREHDSTPEWAANHTVIAPSAQVEEALAHVTRLRGLI